MATRRTGHIEARGKSRWLIRLDLGRDAAGKRVRPSETVYGSKKDADARLHQLLRDKSLGVLAKSSSLSFDAFLDLWLDTAVKPRVRERTHEDYKNVARRYLRGPLGGRSLTQITPVDIQKLYSSLSRRGLAPRTVRYCHTVLHNALAQALKWRMLAQNPALCVALPRSQHREMQAMTEAQAQRFLAAAEIEENYALFALLLATGLRPSEALGLRWGDLDGASGTLSVSRVVVRPAGGGWRFEAPKTSKSRRSFAIPQGLVHLLRMHADKPRSNPHGLMFPNVGGEPLHIQNLSRRVFKRILMRAGLPETFRLYDLRHTCATLLLVAGTHPKVVSDRLGHASISETMDTYSHVIPGMQSEASDKLNTMLFVPAALAQRPLN